MVSPGFLGKAYYHNPSKENGLVLVGAGAGILLGGLTAKGLTPRTALVSRTEGGIPPNASWKRINVDESGNVNIARDKMIHVAIDAEAHSVYFYKEHVISDESPEYPWLTYLW